MSRCGFAIHGFGTDARAFVPFELPNLAAGTAGLVWTPHLYLAEDEMWRYCVRVSAWQVDYSVTCNDGGGPATVSGVLVTANNPVAITDERDFMWHGFHIQQAADGDATVTIILNSYDAYTDRFGFLVDVQVATSQGTVYTGSGDPSGVACLYQGYTVPINISTGCSISSTGSITISPYSYWPYNDGTGAVWDSSSGTKLITPIPTNF